VPIEDRLERLEREIARDLAPVRPFAPPGAQAMWPMGVALLVAAAIVIVMGLRADAARIGGWTIAAVFLAQAAVAAVVFRGALRCSIPGMGGAVSGALLWIGMAPAFEVAINSVTAGRSALTPAPGREWVTGLACLGGIAVASLAPLAVGTVLLGRGWVTRPLAAFTLLGVAGGLAAEAAWRLHCPYSSWSHVLPFHVAALVLPVLVALAAATFSRQRR
jgi:hypothetical protein